jgi:hypothetical protein
MAKWELDCTAENQGPRPGEIRVVNYVDGETVPVDAFGNKGNPIALFKHRIEQFWNGKWAPIKVYHDPGNGKLERIKQ